MLTSLISEMAEGRQGSSASDGPASRMSDKAGIGVFWLHCAT